MWPGCQGSQNSLALLLCSPNKNHCSAQLHRGSVLHQGMEWTLLCLPYFPLSKQGFGKCSELYKTSCHMMCSSDALLHREERKQGSRPGWGSGALEPCSLWCIPTWTACPTMAFDWCEWALGWTDYKEARREAVSYIHFGFSLQS